MSAYIDDLIKVVRDYDAQRPRSVQQSVGWSEVGGCRAYLGYRLAGEWPSDDTDTWGAQRGTAIHEYLERVLRDARPGIRTEVTTVYRGIPGHADIVETDPPAIGDIKTTRLANSRIWQNDPAVMRQKLIQVNGYAAGLVDAGMLPEHTTVRLIVVPVDGTFEDWWAYEALFDRSLADEGADRLDEVRDLMADGIPLPQDMPVTWCRGWCQFATICRGTGHAAEDERITDPELVAAIGKYGQTAKLLGQLKRQQDGLADAIRGLTGRAGDWRISMGRPGADKRVLDEDAVRHDYYQRGAVPPEITKPGVSPRLLVTKIGGK